MAILLKITLLTSNVVKCDQRTCNFCCSVEVCLCSYKFVLSLPCALWSRTHSPVGGWNRRSLQRLFWVRLRSVEPQTSDTRRANQVRHVRDAQRRTARPTQKCVCYLRHFWRGTAFNAVCLSVCLSVHLSTGSLNKWIFMKFEKQVMTITANSYVLLRR